MKSFKDLNRQVVQEGRPSQRHPLEGHEYHRKSNEALIHIAKDAHKAAEAMKSHNTEAENKYRDQANDSATVRYFRQKNGMPEWYKKKYDHVKEGVEIDEKYQVVAKTKDGETFRSGVYDTKKKAYDMHWKLAKGNKHKSVETVKVAKEVVEEGENKEMKDSDPCWKGYQMVGMKDKGSKKVPNCVPTKEEVEIDESFSYDVDHKSGRRLGMTDVNKTKKMTVATNAIGGNKEHKVEVSATSKNHALNQAADHFTKKGLKAKVHFDGMRVTNEQVEQIDELSRDKLSRYSRRASSWAVTHKQIAKDARQDAAAITDPNDHYGAKDLRMKARGHSMIAKKREAGVKKANDRLKKDADKHYYENHWKINRGYYGPEKPGHVVPWTPGKHPLQKEEVSKTTANMPADIGTPAQLSLRVTPKKLETPVYESRQLQIVREAMADAKKKDAAKKKEQKVSTGGDDKFQSEPEVSSSITKNSQ